MGGAPTGKRAKKNEEASPVSAALQRAAGELAKNGGSTTLVTGLDSDDDEKLDQKCEICLSDNDPKNILLCDSCDGGFHLYCVRPRRYAIPKGEWHCPRCKKTAQVGPRSPLHVQTASAVIARTSLGLTSVLAPGDWRRAIRFQGRAPLQPAHLPHARAVLQAAVVQWRRADGRELRAVACLQQGSDCRVAIGTTM
jgi:hypothetical protein